MVFCAGYCSGLYEENDGELAEWVKQCGVLFHPSVARRTNLETTQSSTHEMESWLSGRKRLTANEVSPLNGFAGSNPALSAMNEVNGGEQTVWETVWGFEGVVEIF